MLMGGSICCSSQSCAPLCGVITASRALCLPTICSCQVLAFHRLPIIMMIIKSALHQAGLSSARRALLVRAAAKEDAARNDAVITCRLHNARHHLFVPSELFQQLSDLFPASSFSC